MKNNFIYILTVAVLIIAIATLIRQPEKSSKIRVDNTYIQEESPKSSESSDMKSLSKPELTIDTSKSYTAILHTDKGEIRIELAASSTPITVNNFVYLANSDFYNNTLFHRTIEGFMIQGGDPTGTGSGGPGYRFDDEPFDGEYTRGTVAMANAGPDTNGSQFFIMHQDYDLPKNYVIFGKVSSGLEVLDAIATSPVTTSESGESSKPVSPTYITSVEILEE